MSSEATGALLRGALAILWLLCAGMLAFRGWDPLQLHYLTLFFREVPLFFFDIAASFQKLFIQGLRPAGYSLVLLLAAAGAGRMLLACCSLPAGVLVRWSIRIAAGLAFLSYAAFFLGLLGLYTPAGTIIAWVLLGVCTSAAIIQLRHSPALIRRMRFNAADATMLCFIAVLAVFLLSKALCPAIHVDAITYHLGIPNYYLQEGRLEYIPTDMYSGFPFFTEMLYVLAMLAEGQKSAQMTSVLFFLLSGFSIFAFVKDSIGAGCARLAAVLFLVTPCFMESSLLSGNDLALVYYVLMTLWCFLLWRRHPESLMLLLLAGGFAGVCLSIKYTALTFIPFMLAAGLFGDTLQRKQRPGKRFFIRAAVLAGAAGVVFLPWCIKNTLATGNPVYPALYSVLGGADMSPEMYAVIQQLASAATGNLFSTALYNLSSIFLFTPRLFLLCGPQGNAGLALLFFLPLLLLLRTIPAAIKALCCAAGLFFLTWTLFSGVIRFFYPGIALLIIIAAYALAAGAEQFPKAFKPFFISAAVICMLINCGMGFYQANMRTMTYGAELLHEADDSYLRRHMESNKEALLDSYPANWYINEHLAPNDCVLIIGDVQHLYIHRRHRYTYLSARTPYEPFKKFSGDYAAVKDALRHEGITHILYNPAELQRLQDMAVVAWKREDVPLIEDFLKSRYVRLLYANTGQLTTVSVYKLVF